jgi:hypothetical protein
MCKILFTRDGEQEYRNVCTYNICMNAMYRNLKSGKKHYGQKLKCVHKVLKGLSQEMDLAFEYMHGQF